MQVLPKILPLYHRSWRCFIERKPEDGTDRLLAGEWTAQAWDKFRYDLAPQLMRAGTLDFIACTLPNTSNGGLYSAQEFYKDRSYPVIFWHWNLKTLMWDTVTKYQILEDYAKRLDIEIESLNGNAKRKYNGELEIVDHCGTAVC
jgi:hypothetical protein